MKNKKYNSKHFFALGIMFALVGIGGYISGNYLLGMTSLPMGFVFTIYGITIR